jgi:exopolysaccharide production protein ExoQ
MEAASERALAVRRADLSYFFAIAALLLPSIGMLGPAGTAPLLALAALAVLLMGGRSVWTELRALPAPAALLAAIGLWGMLSAAWSIVPGHSLFEGGRFLLLAFAGLVLFAGAGTLDEPGRRRVGIALVAGLALGLAVVAIELLGDFPLRRLGGNKPAVIPIVWLDRGAQILVLAAVPAAAALGRRWTACLVALAVALALWPLKSSTSVVSLGAAIVAFVIALGWPRYVGAAGAAVFIAFTVAMPVMQPAREAIGAFHEALPSIRTSAHHRLVIWNWTAERIRERPILGWGLESARAIPGGQTEIEEYMELRPYGLDIIGQVMPLHPHDAVLQWWLELGMVGAVLGAALAVWVWLQAGLAGAHPLALTAAAMPPLLLSFGVWQSWWLSTLFLVAAFLRTAPRRA